MKDSLRWPITPQRKGKRPTDYDPCVNFDALEKNKNRQGRIKKTKENRKRCKKTKKAENKLQKENTQEK